MFAGWVLRKRSMASQTNRNDVSHVTATVAVGCLYLLHARIHFHSCETAKQEQLQALLSSQLAFLMINACQRYTRVLFTTAQNEAF